MFSDYKNIQFTLKILKNTVIKGVYFILKLHKYNSKNYAVKSRKYIKVSLAKEKNYHLYILHYTSHHITLKIN